MTSVLILAGSRNEGDQLSSQAGLISKALIEITGRRMIDYVLSAIRDTPDLDGPIWISGLTLEHVLDGLPTELELLAERLRYAPPGTGPADATLVALEAGAAYPLLVTTCDHPLLSPAMIESFIGQARKKEGDIFFGLASRQVIEAAYPSVQRTYANFAGKGYSGCNLFYLATEKGRKAVAFWREVGHNRKRPLKIARRFGWLTLIGILTGRLSLEAASVKVSGKIGADLIPILIPIAEAAIDVDKPSDLALVREILEKAG